MRATTKRSAPPYIRINIRVLKEAAKRRDWVTYRQMADGLGVTPPTIWRLLNTSETERLYPGPRFIAAALTALPELSFEDLFSVHAPHQRERAA